MPGVPAPPWGVDDEWSSRAPRSLPEEFASVVRNAGDSVAVECGGDVVTYDELDRAANQVAYGLLERDEVRQPVGVIARHELSSVVALLGVLKAGGVCVPLDPREPRERLTALIERVGVELVLGDSSTSARREDDPEDRTSVGTGGD